MDTHKFFVEKLRFHLNEPDMLVFVGWFYDGKASGREVQAYLDGEKLPAALTVNKGAEVRQKYLGTINEINEEDGCFGQNETNAECVKKRSLKFLRMTEKVKKERMLFQPENCA